MTRRHCPSAYRLRVLFPVLLAAVACGRGPRVATDVMAPVPDALAPAVGTIREDSIRRDLFTLAGDAMRGREAGTLDELRAAAWIADRARDAGLEPAGDDGSFFQFWPMRRIRPSAQTRIALAGVPLVLGHDVAVVVPVTATIDAPLVFVGEGTEAELARRNIRGQAVAAVVTAPSPPIPVGISLRGYRHALTALRERAGVLLRQGATAVVLVADSTTDANWEFVSTVLQRGRYTIDSTGTDQLPVQPPVLCVRRSALDQVRAGSARLAASLVAESFLSPSVNVVAQVRGTDPGLRKEYVLFSAHQDHDGVRFPVKGDSIWRGADDNASVAVALLAIGRAFAARPGRRSALFVWHGAEERGLLGSRWHSWHPVVPRSSIVAVLNGDMIGRNSPDTAALLGVQPPHRNSSSLVALALAANAQVSRFVIDSSWDRPTHPEQWYFRSDHLPYARMGIPALFFTTLLHADYHMPRDTPSRIDVAKLTRVAKWMYATGWLVAAADQRPAVEPGFSLER